MEAMLSRTTWRRCFCRKPARTLGVTARQVRRLRDVYLADCTHFIPMQMPDRVIGEVEAAIAAWSVDG